MNKKFSTLLVGALLTSSVGAFAASTIRTVGHNIDLRPNETVSATPTQTITKFENKLYQLRDANDSVLVQVRDLTTGVLTMKLVSPENAPINASLWKVTVTPDGNSGYVFNYVNKETNMPLAVDVYKTLKANAVQTTTDLDAVTIPASVVEGCLENWAWYTTNNNGTTAFAPSPVYSYFTQDSVAVLQQKTDGEIVAVKYSKAVAGTAVSSVADAVALQPVEAAAIVLTANDLNRQVDFKYEAVDAPHAAMGVAASDTFTIASSTVPTTPSVFLSKAFMAEPVGEDIVNATGYDAAKLGIVAGTNEMADYVYLKTPANQYLYVSPDFYPANSKFLSLALTANGKLSAANLPAATGMTEATWMARSAFKVTYYPSVDSLVFEPLNALSANPANNAWANADYAFNSVNNKIAGFFTGATVAAATDVQDATVGQVVIRIGYLTPTESVITAYNTEVSTEYPLPGSLLTKFNYAYRTFNYLSRATLDPSLYFIKRIVDGKYVVCNFEGTVQYDAPDKYSDGTLAQNYSDMPATMWVFNSTGCTTVDVQNREYGNFASAFAAPYFDGQLYVDANGNYFTINKNYVGGQAISNVESYAITAVTDSEALTSNHHGYKYIDPAEVMITKYNLAYNLFVDQDLYLDVTADKNFAPSESNDAFFEAEEMVVNNAFGAGANVAGLPQLVRNAYSLKVKDTNLIDNDKYYIYLVEAYGENPYYYAMTAKEAEAMNALPSTTVSKGVFYLKADQVKGNDKYYVLIDINKSGLDTTGSPIVTEPLNGVRQAHCIDNVGRLSYVGLNNIPSQRASAFAVGSEPVALYRAIAADKTAKLYMQRGTAREYLYEDCNNALNAPVSNIVKDFGYLNYTSEGVKQQQPGENGQPNNTSMYVQYIKHSNPIMPQYLFVVDKDTVADGKWCEIPGNAGHGYIQPGDAHSDHTAPYIGYMSGRFLINLTDSVEDANHNMLKDADKFKWGGYTRLGFVEGVYRIENGVEYLYLVQPGSSLKDLTAQWGVIAPETFANGNVLKKIALDGTHSLYAFSLRLVNEDAQKDFLIESKGVGSAIGSFKGSWVKEFNNTLVVLNYNAETGNHEDEIGKVQELINNAQIFNVEEGLDEVATGVDNVTEAATFTVVGGEGNITISGAQGKTVTIANVLGQTTQTVVNSDNAVISVPAGIVVVSVDGKAVKTVVK